MNIKDKKNNIIGYIETDYHKRRILRDVEHQIIAYYYPRLDMTLDDNHNDISKGDILASLMKK